MNNEKKPQSERDRLLGILCILGAVFIVLFVVVNMSPISAWFSWLSAVLNPVIIGFIIAYLCNPINNWLYNKVLSKVKRAKMKKGLSIVLTYAIVLAIVFGLLLIIVPQFVFAVKDLVSKLDSYVNTAIAWANNLIQNSELFAEDTNLFDFIDVDRFTENLETFIETSGDILKNIGNFIVNYGTNIVGGITDLFLGLFISVYVLIFKKRICEWCKRLVRVFLSRERYDSFIRRVGHANGKFGNYIIGAITDSIIVAVEGFIIFSLCGIPYAPLVAVIVGITNIIPILGPFLGAVPSAFIIFIVDPGKVILFIILIIIIQQIDGNIVAPFILGSSLGLSSFGIIVAITVMGGLWGIPGMFIGVPFFAFIADIIEEAVNSRLKQIGDPEFPPTEEKVDTKAPSPIITFVKKYGGIAVKKTKLFTAQTVEKIKNTKNNNKK